MRPLAVNITNIIHMRTSLSRRLNIHYYVLCIMFKIIPFFIIMLFNRLYVRIDILPTYENHFHDRIISLRGQVWAHKTSLTPPLFIGVPVPSQKSKRSYIYALGVSIMPLFYDFYIWFWNFSDSVLFFCFFFFFILQKLQLSYNIILSKNI